jgi:SAM-dependent methyltransferase
MSDKKMEHDFDHPSLRFIAEDRIKNLLGSTYYGRDIRNLALKGDERVLDLGCGGGTASRYLMKFLDKASVMEQNFQSIVPSSFRCRGNVQRSRFIPEFHSSFQRPALTFR